MKKNHAIPLALAALAAVLIGIHRWPGTPVPEAREPRSEPSKDLAQGAALSNEGPSLAVVAAHDPERRFDPDAGSLSGSNALVLTAPADLTGLEVQLSWSVPDEREPQRTAQLSLNEPSTLEGFSERAVVDSVTLDGLACAVGALATVDGQITLPVLGLLESRVEIQGVGVGRLANEGSLQVDCAAEPFAWSVEDAQDDLVRLLVARQVTEDVALQVTGPRRTVERGVLRTWTSVLPLTLVETGSVAISFDATPAVQASAPGDFDLYLFGAPEGKTSSLVADPTRFDPSETVLLDGLETGPYRAQVRLPNHGSLGGLWSEAEFFLEASVEPLHVRMALDPPATGSLNVTCILGSDQWLDDENFNVSIELLDTGGGPANRSLRLVEEFSLRKRAVGNQVRSMQLSGVPAGRYELRIQPGGIEQQATVAPGETTYVDVQLSDYRSVVVRTAQQASGHRTFVWGTTECGSEVRGSTGTLDDEVTLLLPLGEVWIRAWGPDWVSETLVLDTASAIEGARVVHLELRTEPPCVVEPELSALLVARSDAWWTGFDFDPLGHDGCCDVLTFRHPKPAEQYAGWGAMVPQFRFSGPGKYAVCRGASQRTDRRRTVIEVTHGVGSRSLR